MPPKRRSHGEDSIYFDPANNYWVAAVSLGYSPDGKRRRRKVFGRTKTEVRQKLRALHEDIAVNVKATGTYTVAQAVTDWLTDGLDGRSSKTVEKVQVCTQAGGREHRSCRTARSDRA
jgi:hypothetical protein